uniref:Uncharacterized protein LOC111101464 isoform X2 n=1 Tax=Crassostrea virginica TaxID=6565 RepID=A0A8B8AGM3_CRAVI|nr:uncharacterized protein LOC111101464 isoform X2 [Crassostrea virginica]
MVKLTLFLFKGFVLILSLKILHVGTVDGCNDSKTTVKVVATCPQTQNEWTERSRNKNCESYNHSCTSFEYHCVMNTWGNETVEVCAPRLKIIGSVCPEYNFGGSRIQRNGNMVCSSCNSTYDSTKSFMYPECYAYKGKSSPIQTTIPPNLPSTTHNISFISDIMEEISNESQHKKHDSDNGVTIIIVTCSMCGVLVVILTLALTRKKLMNPIFAKLKEFILKDQDSLHELEGEHIYLNTKESTATHGN